MKTIFRPKLEDIIDTSCNRITADLSTGWFSRIKYWDDADVINFKPILNFYGADSEFSTYENTATAVAMEIIYIIIAFLIGCIKTATRLKENLKEYFDYSDEEIKQIITEVTWKTQQQLENIWSEFRLFNE